MARPGVGDTDPASTQVRAVRVFTRVLSVKPISVDDEGVEGRVAGQPDLLQGTESHEDALKVFLSSVLVQICNMKSVALWVG